MTQPRWLTLAWADLGVAETPGPDHTARVVGYYGDVGHPNVTDDETAWCAAFLGSCLERSGVRSPRSLAARSYLDWGEPVGEFRCGAVAVLSRTADPALGHVGFLIGETADNLILLGGNQGDRVSVEAFPRARLLALRWPASPPVIPEAEATAAGRGGGYPGPREASDALFDRALAHVLAMEGGWAEDPHDPGGPTNFGITLATYVRDKGLVPTAGNLNQLKAELKAIPQATVRRIYRERYWLAASCPELPAPLALFHFDAAVNHGLAGAARMLQEAVGAAVDGEVGPETLAKAASLPAARSLARYADIRRRQYRALAAFWRFGRGWLARVERTLAAAHAIAALPAPLRSPQPQEKDPMTDATESAAAPETSAATETPAEAPATKWWGRSLTIWGVAITALSTVLPTVGPLIGLHITPELVLLLGDQVILAVQAVGGLAGTILTVYGRMRATTTLERRQIKLTM
jgi:uncharacterized protein (TIGR02594 family)